MATISEILKNAGIKITGRTKRIGQILSDFGRTVDKGDIAKISKKIARKENTKTLFDAFNIPKEQREGLREQFKGLDKEEIYNALSKQTGRAPGDNFENFSSAIEWSTKNNVAPKDVFKFLKKKTGQFKDVPFMEYGANRPDIFPKVTKKYNKLLGAPSETQLQQITEEGTQAAEEYYAPDQELSDAYIQEAKNRLGVDLTQEEANALLSKERTWEDILEQKAIGTRKYKDQVSQNDLLSLQETQGLTADINAAGQWDSSLRGTRMKQLGSQQTSRAAGINSSYQDYINNMNKLYSRAGEDYTNTIGQYQRNKNRGIWDLEQLEKQRALDFQKNQQNYSQEYITDILNEYGQGSQDYYDRQNAVSEDAADFTKDLYSVGY